MGGLALRFLSGNIIPYIIAAALALGGGTWWYKSKTAKAHNRGMDKLFLGYKAIANEEQRRLDADTNKKSQQNVAGDKENTSQQNDIIRYYKRQK